MLDSDSDPFRPPAISTLVGCLHCGQECDSYQIEWRVRHGADGRPLGFCAAPSSAVMAKDLDSTFSPSIQTIGTSTAVGFGMTLRRMRRSKGSRLSATRRMAARNDPTRMSRSLGKMEMP